jgi:hypothetical protein
LFKKTFMLKRDKIKIYTEKDHSLKKDWLKFLIHPIKSYWGDGTSDWDKYKGSFEYHKSYFTITEDIRRADLAFLPLTLNYYIKNKALSKVKKFINRAKRYNLKSYIWIDGDNQIRFMNHDENCVFIKYFSYRSNFIKNELIRPGDLKYDLLKSNFNGELKIKKKSKIPIVGFDGLATYPNAFLINLILKNFILKLLYNLHLTKIDSDPIIPYFLKRNKILKYLKKSILIDTNFKIRNIFAEGSVGRKPKSRNEFLNNIISSDYTLCYRGAANYSLRFYETLCLGRIPLLIDTDCVLPFQKEIDWENICLIVKEYEIDNIPKIVLDHYNSHSNQQFIEKQLYCREIWLKYLSERGFIDQFFKYIKNFKVNEKNNI